MLGKRPQYYIASDISTVRIHKVFKTKVSMMNNSMYVCKPTRKPGLSCMDGNGDRGLQSQ